MSSRSAIAPCRKRYGTGDLALSENAAPAVTNTSHEYTIFPLGFPEKTVKRKTGQQGY
jgi:hypothetical protein